MNKVESVSFPRSGHKLTTDLLKAYFGPDFVYDEFWPGPGLWREGANFTKNHDFDLDTPILTDRFYLVQVRDPFDAIYSWHKMTVRLDGIPDDAATYKKIFSEKIDYWAGFVRKWVLSDIPNRLIVKYRDLLTNPERVLENAIRIFGEVPDRKRIHRACNEVPVIERRTPDFYLQ